MPTLTIKIIPDQFITLEQACFIVMCDEIVRHTGGQLKLQIYNLAKDDCKTLYETGLHYDLEWLGINAERHIRRQSDYVSDYVSLLKDLHDQGLIYRCFCLGNHDELYRSKIGLYPEELYNKICRPLSPQRVQTYRDQGRDFVWRLKMDIVRQKLGRFFWRHEGHGMIPCDVRKMGDMIIGEKICPTGWALSCALNDHKDNTDVIMAHHSQFESFHAVCVIYKLFEWEMPVVKTVNIPENTEFKTELYSMNLRDLMHQGISAGMIRRAVQGLL